VAERKLKSVTLRDVAERVGVSAMTVSRALSANSHLVNAETTRRCRDAARELGYVPNLMARSLRGEQLQTIVMFAEFISTHHYLAELVDVVSRSIERRKFGVISCQSISSLHQALRNFKLAGAVVIAPPEEFYSHPFGNPPADLEMQASTVLVHSAFEQDSLNEVSPDISDFSYTAAAHLLELGHRCLGHLGGPRTEDEPHWFALRRRGVDRALRAFGLDEGCFHEQPCHDADLAPAALQQLLKRAPETTGILCINDEIALAAIAGARQMGLEVPGDLSVVGCNDIKLARFFRPALTTLAIDIRSMVETALDLLFDQINHRSPSGRPIKIRLPASLVLRESTAAARRRSAEAGRG
jgi:DNA-binding LacI/PurR family transcriptional regulator